VAIINSTTRTLKINLGQETRQTDRTWFSRLLRHPARKRSGSILTTPDLARGCCVFYCTYCLRWRLFVS